MKNKKGFTLIELLAVIAILAILVVFAVPNIIKMFGDSKKKAFVTQAQSVFEAAESEIIARQFKNPGTSINRFYSENASDRLSLSKSDNLKYCIKVENGKVTSIAVVDGSYWYINDNITKASEIDTSDSDKFGSGDKLISCSSTGAAELDAENPIISIGDEKVYGTEHFYVVSTNSTTTALLAKYNLLVGDYFNVANLRSDGGSSNNTIYTKVKTYTSSDEGYGLQNSIATGLKGYSDGTAIGVVPFSGSYFWVSSGLKSEYANSANPAGKTADYASPFPYVYTSSMTSGASSIEYNSSQGYGVEKNTQYTIKYYIDIYLEKLSEKGLPNGSTGRLLSYEEFRNLRNANYLFALNDTSYWLGSAYNNMRIFLVTQNNKASYMTATFDFCAGVRPVIEIPTSSFFES